MAAFVDAEHALDAAYAQKLGVDLDGLLVSQPDNGEQALEIVEVLIRSGGVDVVVVDSVAALVPRAEIEGEMGEAQMGLQARLMSQALRKLTGVVSKSKTCLIFINQLREKIGVMFGNPETTTGGRALKFYASVRVDIRRIASIKDGDAVVGGRTRVKIVKNKLAPPFREAEFDVMYGEGISREGDLLDLAVEHKIVEKSGAWFAYGGERLGQGRENVKQFLKDNPEISRRLKSACAASSGSCAKSRSPPSRWSAACGAAVAGRNVSSALQSHPMLDWLLARDTALRAFLTSYHRPWLDAFFWTLSALGTVGKRLAGHGGRDGGLASAAARPRRGRSCLRCSARSSSWTG